MAPDTTSPIRGLIFRTLAAALLWIILQAAAPVPGLDAARNRPVDPRWPSLYGAFAAQEEFPVPPEPGSPEKQQIVLYTFSPPDGSVTWRIGTAGLIQISADRGRTWQLQASGITTDLVAGSAS